MYPMITTMSKYICVLIKRRIHMKIFIVLSIEVIEYFLTLLGFNQYVKLAYI